MHAQTEAISNPEASELYAQNNNKSISEMFVVLQATFYLDAG